MKKLLEKDRRIRKKIQNMEKKIFILKVLINNFNFTHLIRFNALSRLHKIDKKTSKVFLSNRCVLTINKKKFNKFTRFSRIVFLKLARNKNIQGLNKASW